MVRLTEGPLEVVECFNPATNTCPLLGVCRLSGALHEATRAFFAVLDRLTVADIAANRGALLERLGAAAAGRREREAADTGKTALAVLNPGGA